MLSRRLLLAGGLLTAASGAAPLPPRPPKPAVETGADRLVGDGATLLAGQRVGLITNATARAGRDRLVDRLGPLVTLAAIFAPEHGFAADVAAGVLVADGQLGRLPVHSLYGRTRQPTPQMLDGLDVVVFDIQDVGARPYTYVSTMLLAMQAAARAGLPFVVLDRPNPLGGTRMEGHVLPPHNHSFVGMLPVPLTHGMTMGELALLARGEMLVPGLERLDLSVVPMVGWTRSMLWDETGLPWVPPSPNLPTFTAALAYPGTVVLEATRASEGRGTQTPFTLVGAPQVDGERLADTLNGAALPGVSAEAARFTPRSVSAAPSPKHEGRAVGGLRLTITDHRRYRPVATGVHLFTALAAQLGDRFVDRPSFLQRLAGDGFVNAFTAGADAATLIEEGAAEAQAFAKWRAPSLIPDYG